MNQSFLSFRRLSLIGVLFVGGLAAVQAANVSEPTDLNGLVENIVAHNPELSFYEAEIVAARAGGQAAGARDNPELALEVGRKRVTSAGGVLAGEGTAWAVSVSQTFEWGGRISLRKAIANHDIALAELGLERFKVALASRARTLAFGLHAAHARAEAAVEVAARYEALRELFLARDPGGITPLLETRVIEAQELTLQHHATEAQLAVHAALVELNQLRGQPVDTPITITGARVTFNAAPDIDTILAAAHQNNFGYRAARIELEQQGFVVSLARNEQRPQVTLSPYYSEEKAGETERTYGIGLSLPLPVSRRVGANVAAAEARRRQAETAVLVAQRDMEREVILAAHTFATKTAEVSKWPADSAQKFRDAAELADRHYRLGAVPIGTYVELQNAYLDAIDALYETQQEALEAGGKLQLLTGLDFKAVEAQP